MATLRDNWIVIAIGVAVIAALVLLIWLWWWIPKWQMRGRIFRGEKERADAEDNFRKTVGQVIGGAAVLVGAGLAYLQFSQQQDTAAKEALRQQEASSRQLAAQEEASRNTLRASQDLLISNQVAKGFEQLAGEKIAMRLGGIYALEGVMNTSKPYSVPVLEALCAFVRDGTSGEAKDRRFFPATDIQAALTVIGRRADGSGQVDLDDVAIPGALLIGANLSRAYLHNANLSRASLYGANLSDANVSNANLSGANLSNANLSGTRNLTQDQLAGTCGKPASLPPGLTLDKPCRPKPVAPPLNPRTTP